MPVGGSAVGTLCFDSVTYLLTFRLHKNPSFLDRPGGMGVAEEVEKLELERDEVQELPMLLRPGSVGDGGAEEPEEHEQLSK